MRIYFSGSNGSQDSPEALIVKRHPHIMMTFYDLRKKKSGKSCQSVQRLKDYLKATNEDKSRKISNRSGNRKSRTVR